MFIILYQVPRVLEICVVQRTAVASQHPGVYLFTTPARMMRPVRNLAYDKVEMVGTFEQVYMDICVTLDEAIAGVSTIGKWGVNS